jgi:hypothetical protein
VDYVSYKLPIKIISTIDFSTKQDIIKILEGVAESLLIIHTIILAISVKNQLIAKSPFSSLRLKKNLQFGNEKKYTWTDIS